MRRCTQLVPFAHAVHALSGVGSGVTARRPRPRDARRSPRPVAWRTRSLVRTSLRALGTGVDHGLLDVERAKHVLDHLVRHPPWERISSTRPRSACEHLQPHPRVGARWASRPRRLRPEPLPGGEVALLDTPAGASRRSSCGSGSCSLEPSQPGGGRLLEEPRPRQRVVARVGRRHLEPPHDARAGTTPAGRACRR